MPDGKLTCCSMQDMGPSGVALLHVLHMLLKALLSPLLQQGCHHHLGQRTWSQGAAVQVEDELLKQCWRCCCPTQPQTRRQYLHSSIPLLAIYSLSPWLERSITRFLLGC